MASYRNLGAFLGTVMLAACTLPVVGCDDDPAGPVGEAEYDPDIEPADFVEGVDNPLFPLVPGTTLTYEAETDEGTETIIVEVLAEVRIVNGVAATVVRDRVLLDGELIEDTHDWYAQDEDGNVWYLGEDSKEIEEGEVVSTEGSWEWGVDGALPGVIMWADPAAHLGEEYRQEFYEGEAEDWGKVVAVGQAVEVAAGSFEGCVQTEDWNALEPGVLENKFYCPGVGVVLETEDDEEVELIEIIDP